MQKITTYLWFNDNGEEAMDYYSKVFKNTKILHKHYNAEGGHGKPGTLFSGSMNIEGQDFYILNGGPKYQFTPAISLFVNCETQEEVDHLWDALCDGGQASRCGWLTDKFGLSWQIIPSQLGKLMTDPNPKKAQSVMQAMLKMDKIIIADLQRAYEEAEN